MAFSKSSHYELLLSSIEIRGARFRDHILRIFCYGWFGLQRCFPWYSLPVLLCNSQNIAEYEAYWLMGVPIINS